jgi:uracil phosphoribosyltransferase
MVKSESFKIIRMRVYHLSENNSILNHFLAEIRSKEIQQDRLRFRRNLERIGELMAYELSKTLDFNKCVNIDTPLGSSDIKFISEKIVLATVFRAGLPFHNGFLNIFDKAENAFVSAYRKYKDKLHFEVFVEYIASPLLDNKTLILVDPMLAPGNSMELAIKALLKKGTPSKIHLVSIIASKDAVDYVCKAFSSENITLWVAAIDPFLDEHSYIVPGLGDAGDLAFGEKED